MAEFKISRIRYTWKGNWTGATTYNRDDIVRYGGSSWVCIRQHTSQTFAADLAYTVPGDTAPSPAWVKMVEGGTFRGAWQGSTLYNPTDIVVEGGQVYYCITSHTSSSFFNSDTANWQVYFSNIKFRDDWATSTRYSVGDTVRYGGKVYRCIVEHTSASTVASGLELDQPLIPPGSEKWEIYFDGVEYKGSWAGSVRYKLGDLVFYHGSLIKCTVPHTSESTFDTGNWELAFIGNAFEGEWNVSAYYGRGSVVKYGGYLFRAISDNNNSAPINSIYQTGADNNAWELIEKGINFRGDWTTSAANTENLIITVQGPIDPDTGNKYVVNGVYKPALNLAVGKIYIFNQDDLTNLYYPNANGTTLNPHPLNFSADSIDGRRGNGTEYLIDVKYFLDGVEVDFDSYNGLGFVTSTTRRVQIRITETTPSVLYYWCLNHSGMGNALSIVDQGAQPGRYKTGDVVRRGGNLYVALLDTVSDESSLDYLDTSNWELLAESQSWRGDWDEDQTYSLNDLVIFIGSTYKCTLEHVSAFENSPGDNGSGYIYWTLVVPAGPNVGLRVRGDILTYNLQRTFAGDLSSFGPTALSVGQNGQVLTIDSDSNLFYKTYGTVSRFFYVATDGIDDDTDPQRGITESKPWRTVRYALEKCEDGYSGTTTVYVSTGKFDEVGPMIVPQRTALLGSELRSTEIHCSGPDSTLTNDYDYQVDLLNRFALVIEDILTENTVEASPGNTVAQVKLNDPSTTAVATEVVDLITDLLQYYGFYINSEGLDVTVVGTNTALSDTAHDRAVALLDANKEFLVAEGTAYITSQHPEYSLNTSYYGNLIRRYVEAWKYDIIYTGNYKTLRAARFYRNSVLGGSLDDFIYVRDSSGIRNCTLTGLNGQLNPPNVFDLYQRPTGGAYVSLDPGWGPDDETTWITTRSPYIQNVTTIGSYCVGQKIDGAVHNGGNKSIVSNDFTQVLSGGIGAWVKNDGRAELVSVFTYYCQIGYFAENGGIIRSTNGNCSYGNYGAISDGVFPGETPLSGTVYNKNQQAIVASAFSGDFTDIIQIFEYSHCGEEYTQAVASIVGSGVNADVEFDDIRDDAVFNVFLTDTGTEANPNVGGGGWTQAQNNAQVNLVPEADLVGIKISNADTAQLGSEYLGLRIIITSGKGTGQYGYITAYDTGTRYVNVSRESDDQPGWDHLIPGTPSVLFFDTTTTYRIEPRVTISAPPFVANPIALVSNNDWENSTYGETYVSFTDVPTELGAGTTEGEIIPAQASFNVIKDAREYIVTINDSGAGYAVGDELVILGTALGGFTPDNDLTITVTAISDDSTNSIVSFSYTGFGASGNYVAIGTSGTSGMYSRDGDTWTGSTLPAGSWSGVAAGNTYFIAVASGGTTAAVSRTGQIWTLSTLPASREWSAVAYGNGKFMAVARDQNSAAITTDGTSWTSLTMPTFGDSSLNEWVGVAYGKGLWVAISNSNNIAAFSNDDGATWSGTIMDVILDSSSRDWCSVTYGNNRFVAISRQGDVAYSFDGNEWYAATLPTQDGSTSMNWQEVRYGQGIFFAICDAVGLTIGDDPSGDTTTYCATSKDGTVWEEQTLASAQRWGSIVFGNPYLSAEDSSVGKSTPRWVALPTNGSSVGNRIRTGARAEARVQIASGKISQLKIWDPGSGYIEPPEIIITDPLNTSDAGLVARIGDGVLAQPSWKNRGSGYRTSSTVVTIVGDGFADIIPTGRYITISDLPSYPGPGAQLLIAGNSEVYSISQILELGTINGGLAAQFRVSPTLRARDFVETGTTIQIREKYSQCRISGHDFLDVGTGNFEETNYPELYQTGLYVPAPENEVYEEDGGRVFYTATDQSGNFRAGELFAVEQATGIVTISADFFDLGGLSELRIGGVRLGGSGVVIREFSTDPLFTEDSNNIIPTQRAIAAYLANRLSLGGSDIVTSSFIAGQTRVGPDQFSNTLGGRTIFKAPTIFEGDLAGIRGSILAQGMFFRSFRYET